MRFAKCGLRGFGNGYTVTLMVRFFLILMTLFAGCLSSSLGPDIDESVSSGRDVFLGKQVTVRMKTTTGRVTIVAGEAQMDADAHSLILTDGVRVRLNGAEEATIECGTLEIQNDAGHLRCDHGVFARFSASLEGLSGEPLP